MAARVLLDSLLRSKTMVERLLWVLMVRPSLLWKTSGPKALMRLPPRRRTFKLSRL